MAGKKWAWLLWLLLSLFGAEAEREYYTLLPETEQMISVCVLRGEQEGKTIYIDGGIHGDEVAGWMAAEKMEEWKIDAGTVYIASPVNLYGKEHESRYTESDRDINRNFPGDPEGNDAQRIAAAVYEDIMEKNPDLVLDLHEAHRREDGSDDLRDSLVCGDLTETGELVWQLLEQEGLTLYGAPPAGSINKEVTAGLNIPVITVETDRTAKMEDRIERQIRIGRTVLQYYGIIK